MDQTSREKGALSADEKAEQQRIRSEKNIQAATVPGSIVLAPKAKDVWLLVKMVISFDTGINNMRLWAGTRVPLEKLADANNKVDEFSKFANDYIRSLGSSGYYTAGYAMDSPDQKRFLAGLRGSLVFFPKTPEGERIANLFRALDSALCEFKVRAPLSDMGKLEEVIGQMKMVVTKFYHLTKDITSLTKSRFREPEGIQSYLNGVPTEKPQNGNGKTPGEAT